MPRFAFSTFVKLGHLPSHELSAEIEKYSSPNSGYDFYKTLRRSARQYAGDQMNFEEAAHYIQKLKPGPEKTYNLDALTNLRQWIKKHKPKLYSPPEFRIYTGPQKTFEVRVEPEFTMEFSEILWNVHVFYNHNIKLKPTSTEPALHLLQRKYIGETEGNAHPAILDLATGKLFGKKWNTNRAARNFAHLVGDIARRFE
ncbi:hypothetical protein [Maricaulis virginensis]|uniref:Uncharacterized protein n=1 Tax=Maricaulis virginensis TaxID=144022 RepID=A0A9W6IJQ8_9PROT|nr:hypothetical protein [Maricaulis virginensis]GLK51158.1 hypothetical protein GCM10017621_06660 [Maricaulis virginensis]